jgi:hypothetical protein
MPWVASAERESSIGIDESTGASTPVEAGSVVVEATLPPVGAAPLGTMSPAALGLPAWEVAVPVAPLAALAPLPGLL